MNVVYSWTDMDVNWVFFMITFSHLCRSKSLTTFLMVSPERLELTDIDETCR